MKNHYLLAIILTLISLITYGQKKVAKYSRVEGYSEQVAKTYFNNSEIDAIEGIWQSNDGFKYSIEKNVENGLRTQDKYRIIIISHNTNSPFWKETYVKGYIEKTAVNGVYNIDYYTAGQNLEVQTCIGILDLASLLTLTTQDGDKVILIKIYPKKDVGNSGSFSSLENIKSTGTGFALSSDGYIVTNHHVIKDARTIEVKGVNGNYSKKLSAELIVSDEINELAIIKINDPNFSTFGTIPYTFRQGLAEVGESVFVLGYPMTSSMGEEIKLTNGIISSKTGYQGDISTYQVSVPVQPGNSGGPLFDKNGNVLGIVRAKHVLAENASYAIKINYLKNLTELLPQTIKQPTLNSLSGKILTEQVKVASNYTYLIIINDKEQSSKSSNANSSSNNSSSSIEVAASHYKNAEQKWENNDFNGALEEINLSINTYPLIWSAEHGAAYFFRGIINMYGIGNLDDAIKDFTATIQEAEVDSESAYFQRGLAYDFLEKRVDAIKDFTATINLNRENTEAYFMRAINKSSLNDRIGAISDYDEILKREKTAAPTIFKMGTVYNNKGYCLVELSKLDEALPLLNKALSMEPNESYIWVSRGELYFKKGDYQKCISDMKKAIEVAAKSEAASDDPGLPYYLMGISKIKLGENQEGCKDLSKSGEIGKAEAYQAISEYCK
jgi:S1-C subfamily serine protease/Tfp pilus assembly protein PilF